MGNKEKNGRVDAIELISQKLKDVGNIVKEHEIKVVLLCVFEDGEHKGIAFINGGQSKNRAFYELANAIAVEFSETIEEEL